MRYTTFEECRAKAEGNMYKIEDVAKYLGITINFYYELCKQGVLQADISKIVSHAGKQKQKRKVYSKRNLDEVRELLDLNLKSNQSGLARAYRIIQLLQEEIKFK